MCVHVFVACICTRSYIKRLLPCWHICLFACKDSCCLATAVWFSFVFSFLSFCQFCILSRYSNRYDTYCLGFCFCRALSFKLKILSITRKEMHFCFICLKGYGCSNYVLFLVRVAIKSKEKQNNLTICL